MSRRERKIKKLVIPVLTMAMVSPLIGCATTTPSESLQSLEQKDRLETQETQLLLEEEETTSVENMRSAGSEDSIVSDDSSIQYEEERIENAKGLSESTGVQIVEEFDKKMYVMKDSYAYDIDGANGESFLFHAGFGLTATGFTSNGWYRVESGAYVGYMPADYLSEDAYYSLSSILARVQAEQEAQQAMESEEQRLAREEQERQAQLAAEEAVRQAEEQARLQAEAEQKAKEEAARIAAQTEAERKAEEERLAKERAAEQATESEEERLLREEQERNAEWARLEAERKAEEERIAAEQAAQQQASQKEQPTQSIDTGTQGNGDGPIMYTDNFGRQVFSRGEPQTFEDYGNTGKVFSMDDLSDENTAMKYSGN